MEILGYNIKIFKNETSKKSNSGRKNPRITKIVESFKDNSRKDIDKWRRSLTMMQNHEEPKFDLYHDLLTDLLSDGHLKSQIQIRMMATLNTPFEVYNRKTKKTNEELTNVLNQKWGYQFITQALFRILFGYSLIEFTEFNGEHIKHTLIPRRNVIPPKKRIIPDLEKPNQYIDYDDEFFKSWLIELGDTDEVGILNDIIPNLIWLKNVFQAWAEFCEKFGMPLITATTNTTDQGTIDKVHQMLLLIGEASVGTFPQGTDITFHEASRTDAYNTYLQFIRTNQDVISKLLVGSTMLSDQGTNRSQTEVHERSLDKKIAKADKRQITFIVNDQLLPLLKLQGYNVSEDDRFQFKKIEEEIKIMDLWKIVNGLLKNGYQPEEEWLIKTFNIPLSKKKKSPTVIKTKATAVLKNKRYPNSNCCPGVEASGLNIKRIIDELTQELIILLHKKKNVKGVIGKLIIAEALELLKGLKSEFKAFSPYVGADVLALQMMEYNLFEFASSKTEARLVTMQNLLIDSDTKKLRSFNKFKELAEKEVKDFNTNYLLTEYNLAVATGQNSANYLRFFAEKDTVTSLVKYETAGDNKVRASHEILDGRVFDLNDAEAMDLLPPNGYGCRCEFLQYLGDEKPMEGKIAKELLQQSDPKYKKSQFEMNRANLKQVFTKKQFYNANKTAGEMIQKMNYKDYGLTSYNSFKKNLNPLELDKTITTENVKELFKNNAKANEKHFMGFSDYLQRKMILQKELFTKKAKKQLDAQTFAHVKEVLQRPDEVWYTQDTEGKFKAKYLQFFKDQILVIETAMDSKSLQITDWYLKDNDKNLRTGLKIK